MSHEQSDQSKLREIVISRSEADNWPEAKAEWQLMTIYDKWSRCICGHRIKENCVIKNKENSNELVVGNDCINHFKEDNLHVKESCRRSLQRLQSNLTAKAHTDLIDLAVKLNILSNAEGEYYKRSKSKENRLKINHIVLYGFSANRPRCKCDRFAKPRQNNNDKSYFYSCASGFRENNAWNKGCGFSKKIV